MSWWNTKQTAGMHRLNESPWVEGGSAVTSAPVVFSSRTLAEFRGSHQNSNRQRDEAHPAGHWVTVVCAGLRTNTHTHAQQIRASVKLRRIERLQSRRLRSSVGCWRGRRPNWLGTRCTPESNQRKYCVEVLWKQMPLLRKTVGKNKSENTLEKCRAVKRLISLIAMKLWISSQAPLIVFWFARLKVCCSAFQVVVPCI